MQIYGPAYLHGTQAVNAPHINRAAQPSDASAPSATQGADELQLSDAAQFASRLADVPDIRADRVAQIRAAIADGTYETDEKMNVALDRLLDEIG